MEGDTKLLGMAIKGVDREKWVTISEIAVHLKVSASMAAEVAGVCVFTVSSI